MFKEYVWKIIFFSCSRSYIGLRKSGLESKNMPKCPQPDPRMRKSWPPGETSVQHPQLTHLDTSAAPVEPSVRLVLGCDAMNVVGVCHPA